MREINQDQCVCEHCAIKKCLIANVLKNFRFILTSCMPMQQRYKSPAPVFRKEKQKNLHLSVANLH